MTRRSTALRLLAVLAALLAVTGCASIPGSSRPQIVAESVPASPPADGDDLRYEGLVPRPGASPVEIVRDYLRASGSHERSHARARAYLTPDAEKTWKDDEGAYIIDDEPYFNVSGDGTLVQMSAQQRGRLDADGSYIPSSPPEAPYSNLFRMKKVDGNWRIDGPSPPLLLEATTFEAAYRSYNVYFLDSSRTRVVPDVRWFAAARDTLPSLLMTALEKGPSGWLADGVLSDLDGITVQNNVEQAPDRVRVYLAGLDQAGTLSAGGFAQIVWTLNQVGVGGVELYTDGRLLTPKDAPQRSLQQLNDWRAFGPDGPLVSFGYFVRDGAVWRTDNTRVAGPAGRNSFGAESVGVSTDERALAVVVEDAKGRKVLRVGRPGSLRATVSGESLIRPTWGGGSGEVWTVRNGDEVVLVPLTGDAIRVDVPDIGSAGPIRALRLSRDGARVALVAGPRGQEQLWVGIVVREDGSAKIDGLRALDAGELPVSDVSWVDSLSVVALVRGGEQGSRLYTVDITGVAAARPVANTGLPAPPTAVAAGNALPLLTVAAGSLWRTPATGEPWSAVTEQRGGESAPAYPG